MTASTWTPAPGPCRSDGHSAAIESEPYDERTIGRIDENDELAELDGLEDDLGRSCKSIERLTVKRVDEDCDNGAVGPGHQVEALHLGAGRAPVPVPLGRRLGIEAFMKGTQTWTGQLGSWF